MPSTVVGLFENARVADDVVVELESAGFPRQEIRTVREPADFDVTGVTSFPRIDFETDLSRELTRIGATIHEARSYIEGLRRGGALALATGPKDKVATAANIMNRLGALNVEDLTGPEPQLTGVDHHNMKSLRDDSVMAGRIRQTGGGACFFVW